MLSRKYGRERKIASPDTVRRDRNDGEESRNGGEGSRNGGEGSRNDERRTHNF
ncbi:MAG: hypothetical protein PHW91_04530 [Bacteroidales bacterium]|nr:hypothetical protein [Bacteroidales bacterium]